MANPNEPRNIDSLHDHVDHSINPGQKHITPVHLPKNGTAVHNRSAMETRPLQTVQVVIPSPHRGNSTAAPKPDPRNQNSTLGPATPPLDYQLLLISLAEDYFAAAHGAGSMLALRRRQSDVLEYQKLVATGLSCLEACLKYWRLQPLLEARIRLRYATVLHEETSNLDDAEEALSKGIVICDRLRDFDLKYNLQHLLARVLYRGNSRAALKYLDGLIDDVEAYQHVAWVYAFRFLRVSLSLDGLSHQDVVSALGHLRGISAIAKKCGDAAVHAIANTLEALIHLRDSGSAESVEQAQRAIASTRSSQLDSTVSGVPKLLALTHIVDLCWTLRKFDPAQATSKMQAMQAALEVFRDTQSSTDNGSFLIPISRTTGMNFGRHNGPVRRGQDGSQLLVFDWVPDQDVYSLGFLLSGICAAHKNTNDGQKSENILLEGIRIQEKCINQAGAVPQSMDMAILRQSWRQLLKAYMHLHLTFILCTRTAWSLAQEQLRHIETAIIELGPLTPHDLKLTVQYLEGVIHQGAGNLDSALMIFQSPSLALGQMGKAGVSQVQLELSIISALNAILIIRSRPQSFHEIPRLLEYLEPLCMNHPNRSIITAYNLVIATVSAPDSIVRTKQCLQYALQTAKSCDNRQLLSMTLNFLSWKFFRGVVGEQAEKSARTSHFTAKMGMDRLWMSVSAGILGNALEVQGRLQEAKVVQEEGRKIAAGLPEAVQKVE